MLYIFLANTEFAKTVLEVSPEITVQPFVKLMNSEMKLTGKEDTFTLSQLQGK